MLLAGRWGGAGEYKLLSTSLLHQLKLVEQLFGQKFATCTAESKPLLLKELNIVSNQRFELDSQEVLQRQGRIEFLQSHLHEVLISAST